MLQFFSALMRCYLETGYPISRRLLACTVLIWWVRLNNGVLQELVFSHLDKAVLMQSTLQWKVMDCFDVVGFEPQEGRILFGSVYFSSI